MKKTLTTAALSSVLILGMASAAMAIHATEPAVEVAETAVAAKGATKITLNGALRMRGLINKVNKLQDTPATTAYDARVQLGLKAQVSTQTTGYIELETGAGSGDTYGWGNNTLDGATGTNLDYAGSLFNGGSKQGTLSILQAWINYQPSNWGVKVGHMPLALGNKVFFDHTGSGDDAIVGYMNPSDNTHVAGILIKFAENTGADASDDLDGYVGLVTHKFSDSLNVGANWTYLQGASTGEVARLNLFNFAGALAPGATVNGASAVVPGMEMSNVGLTIDGKATNAISYSADVEFQFGTYADLSQILVQVGSTTAFGPEIDAEGYAVRLAGGMDLGAAKVGLLFGYGSGDDGTDATTQENFINFLTDTSYDNLIMGNYRATIPGTFTRNSGLSNLSLYQINGSTSFMCPLTGKNVDMKGSLSYMVLNEALDSNTGGYAAVGTTAAQDDDEVGTEIDLVTSWHLTPGLDYRLELAYQFVGDVYNTGATGVMADPDDLYFVRQVLEMKF